MTNRHDAGDATEGRGRWNRHDAEDAKEGRDLEPPHRLDRLAHQVIGAALEVHRALGPGYLESVYEEAMRVELRRQGIPHVRQARFGTIYKGEVVGEHRIDILVDDELIVELKAVDALAPIHTAQVISYLKAGALQLGLLINFNVPVLKQGIRRVIWNPPFLGVLGAMAVDPSDPSL